MHFQFGPTVRDPERAEMLTAYGCLGIFCIGLFVTVGGLFAGVAFVTYCVCSTVGLTG